MRLFHLSAAPANWGQKNGRRNATMAEKPFLAAMEKGVMRTP